MTETARAILLMVVAMALFALEDMFIKILAGHLPLGQILVMLGIGGFLIFGGQVWAQGERLLTRDLLVPSVIVRMLGEALGTIGFATAIALTPITTASAIIQAMPLAVTLGADTAYPQLRPGPGEYYTPFFNRYTVAYLDLSLDFGTLFPGRNAQ